VGGRQIIVGEDEWAKGAVRVKQLATREEGDVLVADL
jgi:histidyl-tRNA synthetase